MDHLPAPRSASGPGIDVPFVADILWDFLDFESFPARHGFPVDSNGMLKLDYINENRLASLLQSWLYFGFLSDTFGTGVRHEDFCRLRPADSVKPAAWVLNSAKLEEFFDTWSQMVSHGKFLAVRNMYLHRWTWRRVLEESGKEDEWSARMKYVLKVCDFVVRHRAQISHPIPEILLSIQVLCHTFYQLFHLWLPEPCPNSPATNLVVRQMLHAGWCRAIVTHASREYDINTLHFMSRTSPPTIPWINHDQCTIYHCTANHVHKSTYQNRHIKEDCRCELIHVKGKDKKRMEAVIRRGGVPLIKIVEKTSGTVKLRVVEHRPGGEYVAISHVWSDGLGNPDGNALPLCQLKVLAANMRHNNGSTFLDKLGTSIWSSKRFWMDTLCIPPVKYGDPEYSLRLDCIDRMAFIYATARAVIVLDYGLRQVHFRKSSLEESLVHVACSAWNQRSWTLQEGALAGAMRFGFADGFFNFANAPKPHEARDHDGSHSVFRTASRKAIQDKLVSSLRSTFVSVRNENRDERSYTFVEAWNALRKRTTTMPEDTYVVLANLLGFRSFELSRLRNEDRLKAMILQSEKVPLALLCTTGKKITPQNPSGHRWIPAEIGKEALEGSTYFNTHGKGLHLEVFGVYRPPGMIVVNPPMTLDSGPIWLRCSPPDGLAGSRPIWIRIDLLRPLSHPMFDPKDYKESCVLINEYRDSSTRVCYSAALCHSHKTEMGIWGAKVENFEVHYDCPAKITLFPEPKVAQKKPRELETTSSTDRLEDDAIRWLPWRLNAVMDVGIAICRASRVATPPARWVQDDCLMDRVRHREPFRQPGLEPDKAVFLDSSCTVRFPKQYRVRLSAADGEDNMGLTHRSYIAQYFIRNRPALNVFLHRLGVIAPIICVALIASQASKLRAMPSGKKSRYWQFALACHCIHIVFSFFSYDWLGLLVSDYSLLVYSLILPFVNVPWGATSASGPTAAIELYMIMLPFLISSICTMAWHFVAMDIISRRRYRFWLSSFDRDWHPDQTIGWLAPFSLRKFLRTGNGFLSIS